MKQQNGQKKALIFLIMLLFGVPMTAQNKSDSKWTEKLGGGGKDFAQRIIQNKQGQFVAVGTTAGWFKDKDMAFTIVDSTGTARRTLAFGGGGSEGANSVVQTRDGGYVIAGFSGSKDIAKYGKRDAWLVKVDETGLLLWSLAVGTKENDAFKDVVEAENGDLWLTGQSDDKLWVVRVDKNGKNEKATILSSDAKTTCGNALVWSKDKRILYVVGQKVLNYGKRESQLLLVPFDTEGSLNFGIEKPLPQSEGTGIVRDRKGNLGIVGTSYESGKLHTKILFCYYDVNTGNFSEQSFFSTGLEDDVAEGLGIAEDLDGQFIIVGKSFKKPKKDQKRQAWAQKVGADGKKIWNEPIWYGGTFEDGFTSVVVSERGFPIAVCSTADAKMDATMVAINQQTGVQNPKNPLLGIVAGRFHDEQDSSFLRQKHRGFYDFWIENRDTADVFGILATVRPQKEKDRLLLGDFERIHIGTLRKGEKRQITVPFEGNNNLQRDSCFFDIDFSTEKGPLSINGSFLLRTIDVLKHKLEMVDSSFPRDIRAGETYKFSFSLKNTGEVAATNVQISLRPESGTRITILDKKDRFRTEDIEVGETRFFEASFEVQKEFYADVVLLNIFAQVNEDRLGKPFQLRNNMQLPPPPPTPVADTVRFIWKKPTYEDIKAGNVVYVFQDTFMHIPKYAFEAIIESNKPITKNNVRILIDNQLLIDNSKFDNVEQIKSPNGYPYAFKAVATIPLNKQLTALQIKVVNIQNPKESEVLVFQNDRIPNLYVLAVGVSYEGRDNGPRTLHCTKRDADSICAVLKRQEGVLFNKVVAKSLTSDVETQGLTIKRQIELMSKKMTSNDIFILLLSGHGYIHGRTGNTVVFKAYDYEEQNPDTYLNYKTEIEGLLKNKNVKGHKLVFIDACQGYNNQDTPVKSDGEPEDTRLSKAWSEIVSAGPSYRALLSCGRGELSYEDTVTLKHGAFTYALLEAFKNDKVRTYEPKYHEYQANVVESDADENEEGPDEFLSFKELANFVKKRVPELYKIMKQGTKRQNPLIFDDDKQGIPIFKYKKP